MLPAVVKLKKVLNKEQMNQVGPGFEESGGELSKRESVGRYSLDGPCGLWVGLGRTYIKGFCGLLRAI